jgi:hypothetical protein
MYPINTASWGETTLTSNSNTLSGSIESIPFGGALNTLIGAETINKTVGQVFENGFNLKCWGSTWTPTRAKDQLPQDLATLSSWAQDVLSTPFSQYESAVNTFFTRFYEFKKNERNWLQTTAKDCTKDGLKIYIAGLDKFKGEIIVAFKSHASSNGHALTALSSVSTVINVPDRDRNMTVLLERFSFKMADPIKETFDALTGTTTEVFSENKTEMSMGVIALLLLGGAFMFTRKKKSSNLNRLLKF